MFEIEFMCSLDPWGSVCWSGSPSLHKISRPIRLRIFRLSMIQMSVLTWYFFVFHYLFLKHLYSVSELNLYPFTWAFSEFVALLNLIQSLLEIQCLQATFVQFCFESMFWSILRPRCVCLELRFLRFWLIFLFRFVWCWPSFWLVPFYKMITLHPVFPPQGFDLEKCWIHSSGWHFLLFLYVGIE